MEGQEDEGVDMRVGRERVRPDSSVSMWRVLGRRVPRAELVFCCQMAVIFSVIIASICNLSTGSTRSELWTALLSSCLGYILPNPRLKAQ